MRKWYVKKNEKRVEIPGLLPSLDVIVARITAWQDFYFPLASCISPTCNFNL